MHRKFNLLQSLISKNFLQPWSRTAKLQNVHSSCNYGSISKVGYSGWYRIHWHFEQYLYRYFFFKNIKFYLCLYSVDGGQRAVIFDRISGIKQNVIGEGMHFIIPWLQRAIIFDVKTRPRTISTTTGSKGQPQARC